MRNEVSDMAKAEQSAPRQRLHTKAEKNAAKARRYLPLALMALPAVVYLICNNYLPMFGLTLAFKKYNYSLGILESPWCGLEKF